tara:strand:- start:11665 stop:12447 length:783 start_codon:yes stop_codon:yes gene_type:complete
MNKVAGVLSYKPRKLVLNLAKAVGIKYAPITNPRRFLRASYEWDTIFNWGSSGWEAMEGQTIYNHPKFIKHAVNKRQCLKTLEKQGCPVIPWTRDQEQATRWLEHGHWVMSRERIMGARGQGCVLVKELEDANLLAEGKFYTMFKKKCREFRIHAAFGKCILYQQKRRREDFDNLPGNDNFVRNSGSGWVFCIKDVKHVELLEEVGVKAIEALQLDYGSVDIVYHQNTPYILEVNTASSISGKSTMQAYVDAFQGKLNAA